MPIPETTTPIDLPRQGKVEGAPIKTRKENFATIKADLAAVSGLEDQRVMALAQALHLIAGKADRPKANLLIQFLRILEGNPDPQKMEMVSQFIGSISSHGEGDMEEEGTGLIKEITNIVLERKEKKLFQFLIEVTRSSLKIFVDEKSAMEVKKEAKK
jgi:hypothetical protein